MGLQFGQKKQPAHLANKVQAAFACLGRPKQPKGYLKTMSKQPGTHLAQTVRSNLRPAAFGLPRHKRHAAHADLPQYVGRHVRFRRVQAVFVAGFWAGAQGFRPASFCHGLLPYQNGSHAD